MTADQYLAAQQRPHCGNKSNESKWSQLEQADQNDRCRGGWREHFCSGHMIRSTPAWNSTWPTGSLRAKKSDEKNGHWMG